MADLPPPPPAKDDPSDVAVVHMVHKVKSRLGYTEMVTPTPVSTLIDDNQVEFRLDHPTHTGSPPKIKLSSLFRSQCTLGDFIA